jgi:hypothetical protein
MLESKPPEGSLLILEATISRLKSIVKDEPAGPDLKRLSEATSNYLKTRRG